MKLNLGCHDRPKKGYTNVDKDQYPGVDVVSDVFNLSQWADGCAEVVYASNILEHAPHTKTEAVLKEWNRVLIKGGMLCISVPDFKRAIEIYMQVGWSEWMRNFLWGDQGYDGAFHYTGFDEKALTDILLKCGFEEVSRVDSLPDHNIDECSEIRSTLDRQKVCLNLIAIKG